MGAAASLGQPGAAVPHPTAQPRRLPGEPASAVIRHWGAEDLQEVVDDGEVDVLEHAVAGDVGVDEVLDAAGAHVADEVVNRGVGGLLPALHGGLALAGVDGDGDP